MRNKCLRWPLDLYTPREPYHYEFKAFPSLGIAASRTVVILRSNSAEPQIRVEYAGGGTQPRHEGGRVSTHRPSLTTRAGRTGWLSFRDATWARISTSFQIEEPTKSPLSPTLSNSRSFETRPARIRPLDNSTTLQLHCSPLAILSYCCQGDRGLILSSPSKKLVPGPAVWTAVRLMEQRQTQYYWSCLAPLLM